MKRSLVSVVDDDEYVREALPDLLRAYGLDVRPFASADEFLASKSLGQTGCLVLDVTMPGVSGPELQLELARRNHNIPIVFITANADEALGEKLLERGALAYLRKPLSEPDLLEAIHAALGSG